MEQILHSLLSITGEKLVGMQSLLDLNGQQTAQLQADNVDALHELLDRKQSVMDLIAGLDQRARELSAELEEIHGVADLQVLAGSATAVRILQLGETIKETAQCAMQLDQQNSQLAERLLARLQQQMEDLTTSANASRVYAQTGMDGSPLSIYMNRKM